ncbi:MAG TPA: hypothetical protein EYN18_02745 [Nitrospirales bacterium]|nr:hypothetical protein [Nitrospirales bacterium]
MGSGYPINFEVTEDSAIFLHPLYVKWSVVTMNDVAGTQGDLLQDIGAIVPNVQTGEILAYLTSVLRLSVLINTA